MLMQFMKNDGKIALKIENLKFSVRKCNQPQKILWLETKLGFSLV